ncbi:hypothetical protein L1049_007761 [Liquidambar formosana]|uniref:Uncharacterized protein n=1 Tax=Liquidambar formosana TaxID=63359 RepID=A0AAP0S2D9_LIQFO
MRVSTSQPLVASLSGSGGPVKQKPDTFDSPIVLRSEVASTKRSNHDVGNRSTIAEESCEVHPKGKLDPLELTEQYIGTDCQTAVLKINADVILDSTPPGIITSGNHSPCFPASKDSGRDEAPHITSSIDFTKQPCSPGPDKEGIFDVDGEVQSLCSGLSSVGIHSHLENSYFIPSAPNSSISNPVLIKPLENQGLQQDNSKQFMKPTTSLTLREVAFDNQRMKGLEGICHPPSTSCSPDLLQASNQSSCCSLQQSEVCTRNNPNAEPRIVHLKYDEAAFPCASAKSVLSNGFNDDKTSSFVELGGIFGYSNLFSDCGKRDIHGKIR